MRRAQQAENCTQDGLVCTRRPGLQVHSGVNVCDLDFFQNLRVEMGFIFSSNNRHLTEFHLLP